MSGQNEIEVRMLPVQDCMEASGDEDCPHLFHESYLYGQKYCTCSKQRTTVYVGGDIKDMPSARKELFRTCPLPKAAKKEGGE